MPTKIQEVDVTQRSHFASQYHNSETASITLVVQMDQRKLHVVVDKNGVDVVSDRPSSLLGANVTWQEFTDLINHEKDIVSSDDAEYTKELERELAIARDQNRETNNGVGEPDADYAYPF